MELSSSRSASRLIGRREMFEVMRCSMNAVCFYFFFDVSVEKIMVRLPLGLWNKYFRKFVFLCFEKA